tara:strand:+ start:201 stop:365 length:165 start_codon:yes stop_codon:yes gene_type:complete
MFQGGISMAKKADKKEEIIEEVVEEPKKEKKLKTKIIKGFEWEIDDDGNLLRRL